MNARTKWLLLGAAAVFGLYFTDSFYRSWIEEPQRLLNAQQDALVQKIREANDEQLVAQKVGKKLEIYAGRALPYDPQLARSGYQEWLLNLVEKHELTGASVDAGQPSGVTIRSNVGKKSKRKTVGYRMNYSLRGQASLGKLADFLYDFRQAGHLHKLQSIALNPIGNEGQLDVSLTIEVLSLVASPRKDALSDWALDLEASAPREAYDGFVRRNLFARGFAKALFAVELKAITFDKSGDARAWLRIANGGATRTVGVGDQVPVPLHDIAVVEVLPDRVLLDVNDALCWLSLGDSIGEVMAPETDLPTDALLDADAPQTIDASQEIDTEIDQELMSQKPSSGTT
jgi:hypothetical protein